MTSRADAVPAAGGRPRRSVPALTWRRGLVLLALFALCLVVAQSCQQSQVRVTKERAIETARAQVSFTPRQTQVRLVRQGLMSKPFWAVSLSIPNPGGQGYRLISTVRIDANDGRVAAVTNQRAKRGKPLQANPTP